LQIARNLAPDTRGVINVLERERITFRDDVMYEVCHQLAPLPGRPKKPITGQTVIYDELSIDSLAVMDIVVELEDRFDIAIPINTVAEIRTVKELADAILALAPALIAAHDRPRGRRHRPETGRSGDRDRRRRPP